MTSALFFTLFLCGCSFPPGQKLKTSVSGDEVDAFSNNVDEQAHIYEAVLPIVSSRVWISGTFIRNDEPTGIIHDKTSSIPGKPASVIVRDWDHSIVID